MNYLFVNKDISKLYSNIYIAQNGEICCNKIRSIIYQIQPINIIDINDEYKEKIYNAYYTFIKAMPDRVQIISLKDTLDFSNSINKAKSRLNIVRSAGLKLAIGKYIEKLEEISIQNHHLISKYYLILPSDIQDYHINIMFENLLNNGMQIKQITDKNEIRKIMRKCVKKENI